MQVHLLKKAAIAEKKTCICYKTYCLQVKPKRVFYRRKVIVFESAFIRQNIKLLSQPTSVFALPLKQSNTFTIVISFKKQRIVQECFWQQKNLKKKL